MRGYCGTKADFLFLNGGCGISDGFFMVLNRGME